MSIGAASNAKPSEVAVVEIRRHFLATRRAIGRQRKINIFRMNPTLNSHSYRRPSNMPDSGLIYRDASSGPPIGRKVAQTLG